MCQLFGISAPQPVVVNPWLQALRRNSAEHPHGWGIAVCSGTGVNLEKEPQTAWLSSYLESRLKHPIRAANLIAHIRRVSVGGIAYENCHPFTACTADSRVWTLAHNGTLYDPHGTERFAALQEGNTDSERILLCLIDRINAALKRTQRPLSQRERFLAVEQMVAELSSENPLNLLIFDGELLYVHTNQPAHLCCRRAGDAMLFATAALDDAAWTPMPLTQLQAWRAGELLFQSESHGHAYLAEEHQVQPLDFSLL